MSQSFTIGYRSLSIDMLRLGRYIRELVKNGGEKIRLSVTVKLDKETRREKQNRLMWRWHNEFCKFRYEVAGEVFSPEVWHEKFKKEFIGTNEPVKILGEWVIAPKSTTDLSVKEFAEMLTKYQVEAAEMECQLTSNDDLYWSALMKDKAA